MSTSTDITPPAATPAAPDSPTTTPSTPSSGGTTPTETDTSEFDAAAVEVEYGLPPGSLDGAQTQEEAIGRIKDFTDKMLSAGLLAPSQAAEVRESASKVVAPDKKGEEKKPEAESSALETVMARLEKMEARFQQTEQNQQQALFRQLEERITSEIDKWNSPKYGQGEARNFNQLRAVKELREHVSTHLAGYAARGQQPPTIEAVMRQVRTFHDDQFTPAKKAEEKAPLGTPGAARTPAGDGEPRSIHHAYQATRF